MSIQVEEYIRPDGTNPYKAWFDRLDAQAAAKVVTAKLRMELIVLFGGGTKRRQQADIGKARDLHAEYKARKRAQSAAGKAGKRKR